MLRIAFKEWAVVCKALAEGRQTLILRKGGIAEHHGAFRPEHSRFWLSPTYLHEHRGGIKAESMPLYDAALAERPLIGLLRLSHFVEVIRVDHFDRLATIERLIDLHIWSPEEVRKKFEYRTPGLFALLVRVFRVSDSIEIPEPPQYAGCKSWVELADEHPSPHTHPVLDDESFARIVDEYFCCVNRV